MSQILDLFRQLCLLIITADCFEEFFVNFNFLHVACLKAAISKALGIGIVAGSLMVKVPQIIKILNAKSAEGISLFGTSLELIAILANMSYNFVSGYPFSSYGDTFFLLIQTSMIGSLVLYYKGAATEAVAFMAGVAVTAVFLCCGAVPLNLLWSLQTVNIGIILFAKLVQASANYKNGSTGQLSAITVTMLFFGAMARIFTSIQETGDNIIILTFCVATLANGIIFVQLIYYWNSKVVKKDTKLKKA